MRFFVSTVIGSVAILLFSPTPSSAKNYLNYQMFCAAVLIQSAKVLENNDLPKSIKYMAAGEGLKKDAVGELSKMDHKTQMPKINQVLDYGRKGASVFDLSHLSDEKAQMEHVMKGLEQADACYELASKR